MGWGLRQRKPVLEDVPFVDKRCLAGFAVPFSQSVHAQVTFSDSSFEVVLDWVAKGAGYTLMFRCPSTGRMVERLYLWHGQLVSRHVMGLAYTSQTRGRFAVWEARSHRLRWRLNDPLAALLLADSIPLPRKPQKLPWACYWRKIEALKKLQQAMTEEHLKRMVQYG
jgi:hypothetical protein